MGRRTFSQEFKLEAVRAVRERGLPVAQIARELDIHENLLRKWVRTEEGMPSVRSSSKAQPSEADVVRLQRELKKVTMERDILKKARADSTGRRNTYHRGGVYGTTSGVDVRVNGARTDALSWSAITSARDRAFVLAGDSTGVTSERAAEAIGVSQAVGTRWFRYRGGMPLSFLNPVSGRYLSFAEREEIGLFSAQGVGVREIARRIGRSPSTISRELTRNAATGAGKLLYRASVAQWKADMVAKRPKQSKLRSAEIRPPLDHRTPQPARRL